MAIYPFVITKLAYSQLEGLNHSSIVTPLNHPKYFLLLFATLWCTGECVLFATLWCTGECVLFATLCGVRVSVCSLPLCVVYG